MISYVEIAAFMFKSIEREDDKHEEQWIEGGWIFQVDSAGN